MKVIKTLFLLAAVAILNNFSVIKSYGQNPQVNQIKTQTDSKTDSAVSGNINQRTAFVQANDRYRIGYQDTVEVTVFKHSELSLNVKVNPDGTIFLPRLDAPILAVCKTEGELKDDITDLYKKNYLRDPYVSVRVSSQLSQPLGVMGAVKKPGTYYLDRRITLLELLALAGGQDVEFAGAKIQLARLGSLTACQDKLPAQNSDGQVSFQSYNMSDVTEGKTNPWLQPGDIVSVLQAEEAYVIGNVNKPTNVSLRNSVTLMTAIAKAEGLDKNAKTDNVIIQRQEKGSAVKNELVYNLKDIRDKKIPDPVLQANDVVVVGNDKMKSFSNGLIKAVTGALPNAIYRIP